MADDSELDYIRTFLGKVHTVATVKHVGEIGRLREIADTQRILVNQGELMSIDSFHLISKRYKLEIEETSEANLTIALNNILEGIKKFNYRETITDYTRETSMNNLILWNQSSLISKKLGTQWKINIDLIVQWSN